MYEYAVLDGNEPSDQYRFATSCHRTLAAARREADRLNRRDPNAHYYVVAWGAGRWAREPPLGAPVSCSDEQFFTWRPDYGTRGEDGRLLGTDALKYSFLERVE